MFNKATNVQNLNSKHKLKENEIMKSINLTDIDHIYT